MIMYPCLSNFEGTIVKDNEVYKLTDNNYLDNIVLSTTVLKPKQKTRGHKHDGIDEIYIFLDGAFIEVDGNMHHVPDKSVVLIKGGEFHRVHNPFSVDVRFVSIFQKYERG